MSIRVPPSIRFGLRPPLPQQARDEASKDMRRELSNLATPLLEAYRAQAAKEPGYTYNSSDSLFFRILWTEGVKGSVLQIPFGDNFTDTFDTHIQTCPAIDLYDLVDLLAHLTDRFRIHGQYNREVPVQKIWIDKCNEIFAKHKAAWRFMKGGLYPATSEEEIESLDQALDTVEQFPKLAECKHHYHKALELFKASDYANAGKEALSSLEALAQAVTGKTDTLGALSQLLGSEADLHKAPQNMLKNFYGWSSDDGGMRHARKPGQDATDEAEARFILIVTSAYINMLTVKLHEKGKL